MVKKSTWLQKTFWLLLGLSIWSASVRLELVSPLQIPSIGVVLRRTFLGILDGTLLIQLLQSVSFVFLGLLLGLVLAYLMAVLAYYSHWLRSLFDVYASVLHPLPGVALLPIIILWFGIGGMAVFAVILHAVIWSQYLTIKDGFNKVDPAYIEAAGTNGANKWQLVIYVLTPLSVNAILLSLQIGWSRGWRALISAEMIFGAISSVGGIGWYMYERRSFMDTPGMFAGILLVVLVGIMMEQLVFNRWLGRLYQ